MSVQTFIAPNAREALARIRRELGEDAVVLSTREHPKGVEVLASAYSDLGPSYNILSDKVFQLLSICSFFATEVWLILSNCCW